MTAPPPPTVFADSEAARAAAALIRSFFAAVLRADGSGRLSDFLDPGFVDEDAAPGSDAGPAGVAQKLAAFWAGFPDGRFEPEAIVAAGGRVAVRSVFCGTQTGPFAGRPPSGRAVSARFADFYEVSGGRIVAHRHVVDLSALLAQLG